MALSSQPESHASSKTPHGCFIPPEERLDLAMSKRILLKSPVYNCAHLNYLEFKGRTAFADRVSVNLFLNALRLRWKVSGKTLHTFTDQGNDLLEFLTLEVENKQVIGDLLTQEAIYYLVERDGSDALIILTAIVHDIYAATWNHWVEEHRAKHPHLGHHALIISYAQATSNQLSNNVLAFKDKASPELRRWAEETVSRHLMAIVTPGHLLFRPAACNNSLFSFEEDDLAPDLMGAKYNFNPPRYNSNKHGHSDRHHMTPTPDKSAFPKRKAYAPTHFSPPPKRFKGVYETYRPSSSQRHIYHNNRSLTSRNLGTYPITPENHKTFQQKTLDTPSHTELRKEKLLDLGQKIAQQHSSASKSSEVSTGFRSSGSYDQDAPVVKGPSYIEYLRKRQSASGSIVTSVNTHISGQTRRESFIGSEEGEVLG